MTGFLLLWINGAVGVVGDQSNPANRVFPGVVAVAGALIAGLRTLGMIRAMLAAAIAQVVAAGIAVQWDVGREGPVWPLDLLVLSALFAGLWLLSAWLFRRCAPASGET